MTISPLPDAATCRLVFVNDHRDAVSVDLVVTGDSEFPEGTPFAVNLTLPSAWWAALALRQVLELWAAADTVLHLDVRQGRLCPLVTFRDGRSEMRLAIASAAA